jgi:hypothetical protein
MHVLTDQTPLVVKLLVFAIAVLPLLAHNLRTSEATNPHNLILGVAGLVMVGIEHALGWSDQSLWAIGAWVFFGVIGLTVFAIFSAAPGGAVKTQMALLPWFPSMDFFIVFAAGFLLIALIGYATGRHALSTPCFVVACIGVWCTSHLAPGFAAAGAVLLCGWLGSRRERPLVRDRMARVRTRVAEDI